MIAPARPESASQRAKKAGGSKEVLNAPAQRRCNLFVAAHPRCILDWLAQRGPRYVAERNAAAFSPSVPAQFSQILARVSTTTRNTSAAESRRIPHAAQQLRNLDRRECGRPKLL